MLLDREPLSMPSFDILGQIMSFRADHVARSPRKF